LLTCSFKPRHVPGVLPALLLMSIPALASKWVEVSNAAATTDKVMVDVDSIRKVDGFKTADVMTVYGAPRVNSHGITLDRYVQRTAFNCTDHTAIGISTTGYLADEPVGGSQETADWRTKLVAAGNSPLVIRVFAVVCGTVRAESDSAR
jgi:hypothetical protein